VNRAASVGAIYEQLDRARQSGPLLTNFYPSRDKLQRWIERGELFLMPVKDVLFVLRRDRDFLHLSYVASEGADLSVALNELVGSVSDVVTVDLLGKREQVDAIAQTFQSTGFRPHCTLHRMTKLGASLPPATSDSEVVFASSDDAATLARMLETALDRFTEQIPDEDEMRRAVAERQVLVVRAASAIAGLLFFEVTGKSSVLRHWLVDPAYRDQRIGARLLRRYFADCTDVARFLLWVISDNHNAIDRYRHYGYQQDGLIDQVLIRRPS
jgi:ribosomal protein S18 acetylase RimI-like enzyme